MINLIKTDLSESKASQGKLLLGFIRNHDVTHTAVATALNWRLMTFNLSHKLFPQIPELPLLQLPTPCLNWSGHFFPGDNCTMAPIIQVQTFCFLWERLSYLPSV